MFSPEKFLLSCGGQDSRARAVLVRVRAEAASLWGRDTHGFFVLPWLVNVCCSANFVSWGAGDRYM